MGDSDSQSPISPVSQGLGTWCVKADGIVSLRGEPTTRGIVSGFHEELKWASMPKGAASPRIMVESAPEAPSLILDLLGCLDSCFGVVKV